MRDSAERMRAAFDANAVDILAYLERRVDPTSEAADLLGETMLAAWKSSHRLPEEPERARMWLYGIAKNMILNQRRGRRRHLAAVEKLRVEIVSNETSSHTEVTDQAEDVRNAIRALPDELAELVRLVHWDGFTLEQAATLTGVPAGTARSRYSRARSQLAGILAVPASPQSEAATE